ncbi:MAG: UDP-N-acetylmuramoyl-tripeptide--D-alanyl-D-alanine ligase [Oscillospiraceae bacterium]|nr:UDP-N-acetylmuramoyl-tripeptide--D-alanyl-D-alanine ligase [Oscillospiraceae bacterium]
MSPCTVAALCAAVGGKLLSGDSAAVVTGVTTDSRAASDGQLFIPLTGERFDGHAYIDSALSAGAAGCLTARVPETMQPGKFYIQVADTRLALKALAAWYRSRFTLPVVQITGSAGKTTTKEMVAAVLSRRYDTLKTQANFNNDIGTPLTLLGLAPQHQAAVIETGMNHFGEIRYLGEMVRPDIAVITNVGDAHIENLGNTRQGILQAKCEIFENLAPDGIAVLNGDDPLLGTVTLPQTILRCGRGEGCNVRITDVDDRGIEGIACTVTTARASYRLATASPGGFMIYPMAMAAAIGEALGLTGEEITAGVAAYVPTGSRMHIIHLPEERLLIDDCYNANPQAMTEALRLLAVTQTRRRAAVLGDMGELGELTVSAHRAIGALTGELHLDSVIAIGEKARDIASAAPNAQWFPSVEDALPAVRAAFTGGTAMLVKASHAMHFENIVKELEQS